MKAASASVQRPKNQQQDRSQACLLHHKQHTAAGDSVGLFLCCWAVLLIFPYTRDPHFNVLEEFEDALFQKKNVNGWITGEIFLSFLRDVFILHLGEKWPVVLFVDGHSSHHSLAIIIMFISNAVLIVVNKT